MSDASTPPPPPDEKEVKRLRTAYGLDKSGDDTVPYSAAGMELAMIVVVMAVGGWGLDKFLHTSPWLLLTGCLVGIVGGLYRLIRRFS